MSNTLDDSKLLFSPHVRFSVGLHADVHIGLKKEILVDARLSLRQYTKLVLVIVLYFTDLSVYVALAFKNATMST